MAKEDYKYIEKVIRDWWERYGDEPGLVEERGYELVNIDYREHEGVDVYVDVGGRLVLYSTHIEGTDNEIDFYFYNTEGMGREDKVLQGLNDEGIKLGKLLDDANKLIG